MKQIFQSPTINLERLQELEKALGINGDRRTNLEASLLARLANQTECEQWQKLVYDAFIATQCTCENNMDLCDWCEKLEAFLAKKTAPEAQPEVKAAVKESRERKGKRPMRPVTAMKGTNDAPAKE